MMRRMPGPESTVDTPLGHSVSFAPPTSVAARPTDRSRGPVAVGPGRPAATRSHMEPLATE